MKRFLVMVAVVVMVVGMVWMATADEKKYDWTVYENAPGYSYDKFEKKWEIYATYKKQYSDANLVFGLMLGGGKESVYGPPALYGWIRDKKNTEGLYQITSVNVLIDDTLVTFKTLVGDKEQWNVLIDSENGMIFAKKLSNAKSISIRYKYKTGTISVDLEEKDIDRFRNFGKLLVENDPWQFIHNEKGYTKAVYDKAIKERWPMEIDE